jgi:phosphatidylglycerophosphatase A
MPELNPRSPTMRMLLRPDCAIAFGFGLGLLPWMPGTFGALLALPIAWLLQDASVALVLAFAVVATAIGIGVSESACRFLRVHDHGAIVWDEVCGASITLLMLPAAWPWWIAGFLAFRFFDIVKPWPIGLLDSKLDGGLGVMMDDVAAGLIAGALLLLARWVLGLQ